MCYLVFKLVKVIDFVFQRRNDLWMNGGSIVITCIYEWCKFSLQLKSVSLKFESQRGNTTDMAM